MNDLPALEAIFFAALEKGSPEERAAFLDRACAGDPDGRRQVEKMLAAQAQGGSFLEKPAVALGATMDAPAPERPGTVIGPYKLLQVIGAGGMGTVYMAEQGQPVQRKVALKIVKAGMDTAQVVARFEAERQALAVMDHPNIARVFDAGTTESGRPYFVMELVRGVPITEYCDEHRLTPTERLELFLPVCQAIQHAHQKGIIHRDIKPSNVLVAPYDGRPVVKVIDFGVAKAAGQRLTDRTLFTEFGAVVGTLEYMSPEQAELNNQDIDTRSDVYSLGVLLYELLTGTTPLTRGRLREAAFVEVLRLIREEEPPRPSTRLSDSADSLPAVSAQRHTDPDKLTRLVRGELDWIVMKALEKDRSRRYETANGFAADVQRYLADEAVQACPPSAAYRLRKFVRRNRRAVLTATVLAVAASIAIGAVGGSVGWASRDREARQAAVEQEATLAFGEAERWQGQGRWSEALTAAKRAEGLLAGGGGDDLRDRVRRLRKDLEMVLRLEELPLLHAGIREHKWDAEGIDRAYAEAFAAYGIDLFGGPVGQAAARIRARPGVAAPLIDALDSWTGFLHDSDTRRRLVEVAQAADPDPWRRQLREARKQKNGNALVALVSSPDLLRQPPASLRLLAGCLRGSGQADASLEVHFRAQRQYPGDLWLNFSLAVDLHNAKPPRLDEAVAYYRAALALLPRSPILHDYLGRALAQQNKLDDAVACYEKAIELDANYAPAHSALGRALLRQNKLDDAIICFKKATALNPKWSLAHNDLGLALKQKGRLDEAIEAYKEAVKQDPSNTMAHNNLGNALLKQNKLDEAIEAYKEAVKQDPKSALAHKNLGYALGQQHKLDDAIAEYKKGIEFEPNEVGAYLAIGNALSDQKDLDGAITWIKKAIALDPKSAPAHNNLGNALLGQKKPGEAVACFKKAIELDPKYARAHYNLGYALSLQNRLNDAVAEYKEAINLDPNAAGAHYRLGGALSEMGLVGDAIASYREAIRLEPDHISAHRNWAWLVTAGPDRKYWDGKRAVELATRLGTLAPADDRNSCLLGAAHYRAGNWKESLAALQKSMEVRKGGLATDWYLLAMVEWQVGNREEARKWYDQAVRRTEKNKVQDGLSCRLRAEAAELLRVGSGAEAAPPPREKK